VIDEVNAATAGNEDLYVLARTVYADPAQAMEQEADIRDRHFGPRVTYSRKVFIPLTKLCRDNWEEVPGMHVHAFTPLEVSQGATTLDLSVEEYLEELKEAGLGTLPGTAAEILDDEVRAIICPDKIDTRGWSDVMRAAHAIGLRSTTTIMFGHVEGPANWARHLLVLREIQAETGGFTEFVPLPFVHMGAPLFLQGRSRKGPTFAEALKMHAVGRIALHGYIDNVQVSWVKMRLEGSKACLNAGCNDLGGTLMNENISRAAGASHGQEMLPAELEAMIEEIGRAPRRRTTLYGVPEREYSAS
jgi:FO synthase